MLKEQGSIFSRKTELIFLIFPFFFLVPVFISVVSSNDSLFLLSDKNSSYVANLYLLGFTHTFFTTTLLALPQVKPLSNQLISFKNRASLLRILAIVGFVYVLFFSIRYDFVHYLVFSYVINVLGAHHTIKQFLGFNLLYGTKTKDKKPDTSIDYKIHNILIGIVLVTNASIFFKEEITQIANNIGVTLLSLVIAYYLKQLWSLGLQRQFIYSMRLFIIPLIYFSKWGLVGFVAIHGIEYFILNQKILLQNKHWKSLDINKLVGLGVLFLPVMILIYFLAEGGFVSINYIKYDNPWTAMLFCLGTSYILCHYYLDRQIYKFREALPRQTVLPLIWEK